MSKEFGALELDQVFEVVMSDVPGMHLVFDKIQEDITIYSVDKELEQHFYISLVPGCGIRLPPGNYMVYRGIFHIGNAVIQRDRDDLLSEFPKKPNGAESGD